MANTRANEFSTWYQTANKSPLRQRAHSTAQAPLLRVIATRWRTVDLVSKQHKEYFLWHRHEKNERVNKPRVVCQFLRQFASAKASKLSLSSTAKLTQGESNMQSNERFSQYLSNLFQQIGSRACKPPRDTGKRDDRPHRIWKLKQQTTTHHSAHCSQRKFVHTSSTPYIWTSIVERRTSSSLVCARDD